MTIYAKPYSYSFGTVQYGIESLTTQPDATWIAYAVPDVSWLYLDSTNTIQVYTDLQMAQNAMARQIAKINQSCQDALQTIVAGYPALEMQTWPQQYQEAVAWTANSSAPTPTLSAIATAASSTVSVIAPLVLQKASAYVAASGAAVGRRQLLTAQIQAQTTLAGVLSVVW